MSLDVYLEANVDTGTPFTVTVFTQNITHNLGPMAREAGIYQHLWRPDELGITHAEELIEPLETGVALMESDPARFEKLNPSNRWGSYEDFVPWIRAYISKCREHPKATVRACR